MGLDFDVLEFCKKLRQNRPPPYQCPLEKCDKVYKSLCGLQYHLVNYDHDNPTPATPAVASARKKGGRFKTPVPTGDIALQSPPKEALTFAEAQKVVQFEVDGKISRIPIDEPLQVMSLEEWEKKNAELEKPIPFIEPVPEPHVKLPEASYELIPDYNERVCDAPPRPNAYIRFIEKSAEELDGEVEYDVDEEDTAWLAMINKTRAKQGLQAVSVDTLELLMDRLEKESYFQAAQNGQQTAAPVDEDAVCCICMDGECQNTNVILFCDMCNLAVHQDCYGVPYIPEGQWLCRRCLQSPSRLVNCVLCPNTGGAFKQTDQSTWAHVVCALWIPEVRFANTVFLEPIDSIEMIPMARWKLQCMVCKQRGAGACIQCHRNNCYSAFHVTCAQQAGLYMKMEAAGGGRDPAQPVQVAKMAYCDAHTPQHVLQERRALESEGDAKSTDLTAIRQKGREKIKQARRMLAMKRSWSPVVLVPTLAAPRVAEVAGLAPPPAAPLLRRLLPYWTLKRHARHGVPLLRRLTSAPAPHGTRGIQDGTVNIRELCNQLKYWQRIRQDLERARLLCELVRKRERLKAEYTRVWERLLINKLRPERAILRAVLRALKDRDSADIFYDPVDVNEVPDYSTIVKQPMDLMTMEKKLEAGEYSTVDDIQADFRRMVDNCLAYNDKDTVFYKAGVKMRDQCAAIFRSAKRDLEELNRAPQPLEDGIEKEGSAARSDRSEASPRGSDDEDVAPPTAGSGADADGGGAAVGGTSGHRVGKGRGRGRRRGRGRGGRRGPRPRCKQEPVEHAETPTSGSETPAATAPPKKVVERTQKLATPEKSPASHTEQTPSPGLGLMGGLRKPTLLLTPPTTITTSPKSFGSDATLPTLSASMGHGLEISPKKKGRGRPRKQNKSDPNSSTDLFRPRGSGSGGVPASFTQYRGPRREAGSDSDRALSRSTSRSSRWSQSCSSCTHYDDDDDDMSERSFTLSSSDNELSSSCEQSRAESPLRRRTRLGAAPHIDPAQTAKARGARSPRGAALWPPLTLVWAKCRGYPWYPALIIDPKIPKGYIYNGVPLPVPPQDVLNLKRNHAHEPVLYLVLFFDVKRTWQWLPPNKLEPLGVERSVDQAKLVESRKPTERKAVKKAYNDAMQFRKQVDGDDK